MGVSQALLCSLSEQTEGKTAASSGKMQPLMQPSGERKKESALSTNERVRFHGNSSNGFP